MPLNRPILDDRSYEQLRDALVGRIPVYAPEWTDHNASDPGITLIELFAFLGENLLYRFNQIPDATYLAYLRLLQLALRPAVPAQALLACSTENATGVPVPLGSIAKAGDLAFETLDEVRVLPLEALACCKAATDPPDDDPDLAERYERAADAAGLAPGAGAPYETRRLGPDNDLPLDLALSVDGILWVALLAADAEQAETVRDGLAAHPEAPLLLNLGFVPDLRIDPEETVPGPAFTELTRCPGEGVGGIRHAVQWEIAVPDPDDPDAEPTYRPMETAGDGTLGLTREGVLRLRLPADLDRLGPVPPDDPDLAGTGHRSPLLDEADDARVVCWLRVYRLDGTGIGQIMTLAANAVRLVQSRTTRAAELLGTGTGQPGQGYDLVNRQVIAGTVRLQVEEPSGWTDWAEVGGFDASGASDRHYRLDAEAGRVRFGDGRSGRAPQIGERIRVLGYRYGGGAGGNVAAGAIKRLEGIGGVEAANPLPAYGGADAEPLEQALERIPGELRRRDRAVTRGDFAELALATPGADLGRAECLPLRIPNRPGVPSAGAVSMIIWPREDPAHPEAPLPDRKAIALVCNWLDARRLVTTELYVRPPRYRRIAVAVGVEVAEDHGIDAVRRFVEQILRQFVSPLPPFGPDGAGWPLGRTVLSAELTAAALQVEGVDYLHGLDLADLDRAPNAVVASIALDEDEVPSLAAISVESGPVTVSPPGAGLAPPNADGPSVPVPLPRETC
jgi:hypothetical protein